MKNIVLFLAIILLFDSCYSYKKLEFGSNDYLIGEKYEIKVGNRKSEKVTIKEVTDSTIVVIQRKNEIILQKSMITEAKLMKISPGKTILVSVATLGLVIVVAGIISFTGGNGPGLTFGVN
ncbi:hypothetical protein [[Muricauda] lutisoli]|uniref:Uncharacterized protein n=1 Tax=[Muricauda] lutisoli TaxID=2816035 RepID=A0ABS3ET53_9FLAO|nr:hypothetical protein [[Muricauda] lutisoli]MBO0328962.1 hypothetical protein [[Muricauda] lutisoli]